MDKLKLINEVKEELKDILIIPEGMRIEECNATSYIGRCYIKQKRIVISSYIKTEQDYKDTLAHELIHLTCSGHGKDFKEYCNKINSLGLGYNVRTNAKEITNLEEIRKIRKEKREERKSYLVYCSRCGWARIYKIKFHRLNQYCCPKCGGRSLRQKQFKDSV